MLSEHFIRSANESTLRHGAIINSLPVMTPHIPDLPVVLDRKVIKNNHDDIAFAIASGYDNETISSQCDINATIVEHLRGDPMMKQKVNAHTTSGRVVRN